MRRLARGAELFRCRLIACIMPIRAKIIGPSFSAASVTQCDGLNLPHAVLSAFGISFASQAAWSPQKPSSFGSAI
jgi:hypothetical protein